MTIFSLFIDQLTSIIVTFEDPLLEILSVHISPRILYFRLFLLYIHIHTLTQNNNKKKIIKRPDPPHVYEAHSVTFLNLYNFFF